MHTHTQTKKEKKKPWPGGQEKARSHSLSFPLWGVTTPIRLCVSLPLCPGKSTDTHTHTHTHTHIYTCINLHGLHDDGGGDSKAAGWRCGTLMRGPNLIIIIYSLYLSWIYRYKFMLHLHVCVECVIDDWGLMQIVRHSPYMSRKKMLLYFGVFLESISVNK